MITLQVPVTSPVVRHPFGMRWHPILKRNRLHKGIDYANLGTIMAAGNGKVRKIGYWGHKTKGTDTTFTSTTAAASKPSMRTWRDAHTSTWATVSSPWTP